MLNTNNGGEKASELGKKTTLHVKAYDFTVKKVLLGKEGNERGHKGMRNIHLQHRKAAVSPNCLTCLRSQFIICTIIKERKRMAYLRELFPH